MSDLAERSKAAASTSAAWGIIDSEREGHLKSMKELRQRIAELEAALREARLVCEWIGETPSQRGSINGKAAQVSYRISELLKD